MKLKCLESRSQTVLLCCKSKYRKLCEENRCMAPLSRKNTHRYLRSHTNVHTLKWCFLRRSEIVLIAQFLKNRTNLLDRQNLSIKMFIHVHLQSAENRLCMTKRSIFLFFAERLWIDKYRIRNIKKTIFSLLSRIQFASARFGKFMV